MKYTTKQTSHEPIRNEVVLPDLHLHFSRYVVERFKAEKTSVE